MRELEKEIREHLEATAKKQVSKEEVIPLDQHVADDRKYMEENARFLLRAWTRSDLRWHLPDHLVPVVAEWSKSLDAAAVEAYCASISSFIRGVALDASTAVQRAHSVRIEALNDSPYLEVFPVKDSLLAEEVEGPYSLVSFGVYEFAEHISRECCVEPAYGELAWRALAVTVDDQTDVLPHVSLRKTEDRTAFEVAVRPAIRPL